MKKLMQFTVLLTALVLVAGCLTRAKAWTKKTLPDGSVIESEASVFGTGDKASEVAAEGLFADGSDEDLGAGFKNAKASQQSTGIGETVTALGTVIKELATLAAASQGIKTGTATTTTAATTVKTTATPADSLTATEVKQVRALVAANVATGGVCEGCEELPAK